MINYFKFKLYGGTTLIVLEVIWMIWYISLNIAAEVKTQNNDIGYLVRETMFSRGIHIAVILAIILVMGINRKHIHVYIIFLFIFEMVRDVFVITNTLRSVQIKDAQPSIYNSILAISIYQLMLSTLAFIWCAVLIAKNPSTIGALAQDVRDAKRM